MNGTVMVFIAPDGRPIAHAANFDQGAPGGYTIEEAQKLRCRDALNAEIMSAYAGPSLVEAITADRYTCERIVNAMVTKGFRVHTMVVEVPL